MGNIADFGFVVPLTGYGERYNTGMILLTENSFDQRTFTSAIRADQGDHLTAVYVHIYIVKNDFISNLNTQIGNSQTTGVPTATAVYTDIHLRASFIVLML